MKRNSVSLKHFVPLFHFQTINHCLESKFPIGIDPFWANINKLGLCLFFFFPLKKWNSFTAAGEQLKSNWSGFQCDCGAQCLPSLSAPHFPGPLTPSGGPSPLARERRAQCWVGGGTWLVGSDGRQAAALLQDHPDSWALRRGTVYLTCVHQKWKRGVGYLYKTEQKNLWNL